MKRVVLLTIATVFTVLNGFSQAPSFTVQDTSVIYYNSGENHIYISSPSNGGDGSQNLTFKIYSRDNTIADTVGVGINYSQGDSVAILKIKDKGQVNSTYVIIELSDDDGTFIDSTLLSVVNYNYPGLIFEIHDAVFWQEVVPIDATSVFDTLIQTSEGPYGELNHDNIPITVGDDCDNSPPCTGFDFYTAFYKGMFIPPTTGDYTFFMKGWNKKSLWLSTDDSYAKASSIIYTGTKDKTEGDPDPDIPYEWKAEIQTLEAGKPYAFYATQWVVHNEMGGILVEGPTLAKDYIDGKNSMPVYDPIKPSTVETVMLITQGTDKIIINWSESTDNLKVVGYNIYMNGVLYNTEVITELTTTLTGLATDSKYSIVVTAIDQLNNESLSSPILNTFTYPIDTNNPTPPTTFVNPISTGVSAKAVWSGATDDTKILGYNVYVNDVLYNNSGYTFADSTIIYGLKPNTSYSISLEAVDVSYNVSDKSSEFTILTSNFNPDGPNLGEKIGRAKIEMVNISWNEGIGINGPYEDGSLINDKEINEITQELEPGLIRWGSLTANHKTFAGSTGIGKVITYGDMLTFAKELDCMFSLTAPPTGDYSVDKNNTFTKLMEYLGGPVSTPGGKIRDSEGYVEPFIQNSKGIIIEFGNEVWGGSSHGTEIGEDYTEYAKWCREAAIFIKASPYYDSTKITIAYSGRNPHPSDSFGLSNKLLVGDSGEVGCMAVSGYLGGNLDYDTELPPSDSELGYYKNVISKAQYNIDGLVETMRLSHKETNTIKSFYFYESNLTTPSYNGRVGQATIMVDYMANSMEHGSIAPSLFHLNSGEWKIVSPSESGYTERPMFTMSKFFNRHCKGDILKTTFESNEIITNAAGTPVEANPVGIYAYGSGTDFSILLMGRDFENDFTVQLDLPDDFSYNSTGKKYILSNNDFSARDLTIDSTDIVFADSLLVDVPKFGMVILTFTGEDPLFEHKPVGFYSETLVESLVINPLSDSSITESKQRLYFLTNAYPDEALIRDVDWTIINPDSVTFSSGINISGVFYVKGSGENDGNGTITLRATSKRNPSVFADYKLDISNQETVNIIDDNIDIDQWFYPNPASNYVTVNNPFDTESKVAIRNIDGKTVYTNRLTSNEVQIDLNALKKGVYVISITTDSKVLHGKLIKQ